MQRMFMPLSVQTKILLDDLVVTTDVDTFVMSSDIFDEIINPWNRGKISILQVFIIISIIQIHTHMRV